LEDRLMTEKTVLLICRDEILEQLICELVAPVPGLSLERVDDYKQASSHVEGRKLALILWHLGARSPVSGLTRLLGDIISSGQRIPVLVLTDEYQAEQALSLIRLGVLEYLNRPLDLGRLSYLVDILTIEARYGQRLCSLPDSPAGRIAELPGPTPFLYLQDGPMGRTIDQIKSIAPLDTNILLGGPTGTGKTSLAGAIHRLSPRRDKPFLTINCGALTANLIESEMFGHVRGAYTGADADRVGKFAAAGRGTLFLDEIDSLTPELQAKLLRVVEERAFEPVGSNKTQKLQARLIAASNRPLEQEVSAGRFRADLYYRLNVVAFNLLPLSEQKPLIPSIASFLLAEFAERNRRPVPLISPAAMRVLEAHSWPGNIRELRNVLERAVALSRGPVISREDLPDQILQFSSSASHVLVGNGPQPLPVTIRAPLGMVSGASSSALAQTKDRAECTLIQQALERNGQNRLRAAADLGISRMTLYKKLHKYGLMGA
jgi:two-component system response regulator HydG